MVKIIALVTLFSLSTLYATENVKSVPSGSEKPKATKRIKKVSMCPTCGKPESKCDCHEEHKEIDKEQHKH